MEHLKDLLAKKFPPSTTKRGPRCEWQDIVGLFLEEMNKSIAITNAGGKKKWPLWTASRMAKALSIYANKDQLSSFYYLLSICKQGKIFGQKFNYEINKKRDASVASKLNAGKGVLGYS